MSIGKSIFLVLTLLSSIYANEGTITVVSNKNVVIGDIVELDIRAVGNVALFPTVKNIDGAKVLSHNERITHMPVYNQGELKRECTTLTLTFAPKKDMTIPSYLPKGKQHTFRESEALKILYGHISEDPEAEVMVHKLYARKNGDKSVELKTLVERYTK